MMAISNLANIKIADATKRHLNIALWERTQIKTALQKQLGGAEGVINRYMIRTHFVLFKHHVSPQGKVK